jgi:hypothetical protein
MTGRPDRQRCEELALRSHVQEQIAAVRAHDILTHRVSGSQRANIALRHASRYLEHALNALDEGYDGPTDADARRADIATIVGALSDQELSLMLRLPREFLISIVRAAMVTEYERRGKVAPLPEDMARRVLHVAIREGRCAELLTTIHGGGAVLIDDEGHLVMQDAAAMAATREEIERAY